MRRRFAILLVLMLAAATLPVIAQRPQPLPAQQSLPITQVLLYKNGMAYIVRSGQLAAPLSLTFHPEDMNDILKSFTAWNPQTNSLYPVGYTAGIPTNHMLRRFPFDVAGPDVGLGTFLSQVKGADVHFALGGRSVQGKLMAVQRDNHAVLQQTFASDHRLTVLLKTGALETIWLSDVRSVEFTDRQLRDQLREYLDVLGEVRQDVTREVSVYPTPSSGPIRVAYLQQFPMWKTSYRIDLGERESEVQGWAQIDNPTGEAWTNVQLSLLSGTPVSFVMNLYEPLYTNRATVSVPGSQVAAPRQYESAVTVGESITVSGAAPRIAAAAPPPPALSAAAAGGRGGGAGAAPVAQAARGGVVANARPVAPAFEQADATQIVDAFEYKFPFPVQLASRQSALLPFVQKTMNVERLSIFNARTDRGNPRLGARLENNTGVPFEPGPVTFFERGVYSGEAVLPHVARGDRQLVSYGLDQDVVLSAKQDLMPETTTRLTISGGTAVLFKETLLTYTYEIRNKGAEKTLVIEHPRTGGRTLRGVSPWETTDGFYRFRMPIPSGSMQFPVVEVLEAKTSVALSSLTRDQLVLFSGDTTPAAVRLSLGQIVDLQEQFGALVNQIATASEQRSRLFEDQARLRENLKALGEARDNQLLRKRYLDQLSAQEDEIERLQMRADDLARQRDVVQARVAELISSLSWTGQDDSQH